MHSSDHNSGMIGSYVIVIILITHTDHVTDVNQVTHQLILCRKKVDPLSQQRNQTPSQDGCVQGVGHPIHLPPGNACHVAGEPL